MAPSAPANQPSSGNKQRSTSPGSKDEPTERETIGTIDEPPAPATSGLPPLPAPPSTAKSAPAAMAGWQPTFTDHPKPCPHCGTTRVVGSEQAGAYALFLTERDARNTIIGGIMMVGCEKGHTFWDVVPKKNTTPTMGRRLS